MLPFIFISRNTILRWCGIKSRLNAGGLFESQTKYGKGHCTTNEF
jgi:hypothetical protein